jgi:group I intron endonuclease
MAAVYGIVYKLTFRNGTNGKSYIGQSIHTAEHRLKGHIKKSRDNPTCLIHKAIAKYGVDNIICETIDSADSKEKLNECEIFHIKENNSFMPHGYNMTHGGEATTGYQFTDEVKEQISQSVTLYFEENPDAKELLSIKAKQRFEDPKEREHSSIMAKQRFEDPEERQKISIARTEYYVNHPEAKQIQSESMSQYYIDHPDAIQNLSEKATEQWASETARQEQSVRKKEQYAKNPEKRKAVSQAKKEQIANNPEYLQKLTDAARKKARAKHTRPIFCAYKDAAYTEFIGEWDFIPDCTADLFTKGIFPNNKRNKINEVLKGERLHTYGVYFKYKL